MATIQIEITGRYRDEVDRACRELEEQMGTRLQWGTLPMKDASGDWHVTGTLLLLAFAPDAPTGPPLHRRIILADSAQIAR